MNGNTWVGLSIAQGTGEAFAKGVSPCDQVSRANVSPLPSPSRGRLTHSHTPTLPPSHTPTLCALLCVLCCSTTLAQAPRINTLFPLGGKAGSTVEVELRGTGLDGAELVLTNGKGISGEIQTGGAKVDEKSRPVWQQKCGTCHELRSFSTRSLTPAQWAATVDRMVRVRNAPISADEQDKITQYLTAGARTNRLIARLNIAQDAQPGVYEIRAITTRGVSTAGLFEVGKLPEYVGITGKREQAQEVKLPSVANGSLSGNGERHYYRFQAAKGRRLVFNLKAFRYNESVQMFFNPDLRLYDSGGAELTENHGYYDLDPLIDWTCPADGEYTVEVRDLLGRGNQGAVYRLMMGSFDDTPYAPGDAGESDRSRPPLTVFARPDSITVRPGLSTLMEIAVPRRAGVSGEIIVTVDGLPQGVTASPLVIPADRNDGWLMLTASQDAAPLAQPFRIMATVHATTGDVIATAIPQHIWILNNQPRYVNREQAVIAVRGQMEFTAQFVSEEPIRLNRQGTQVKVLINRNEGFRGPVTVRLTGLPPGWFAAPETAAPDKTIITLLIRPDGRDQSRDSTARVFLEANSDEFRFVFATAPIAKADAAANGPDR